MRKPALIALLLACASSFSGFTLPDNPKAHINDYAGVLHQDALERIELKLNQFEQKTGHQAVVAIFSTLDDLPVDDVAAKLFEKWKLGSREKNDGILLILSMKEHAIKIEVGYGVEGQLPDALAGRIIHEDLIPFLKQGQPATAILVFENRLEQLFSGDRALSQRTRKGANFGAVVFWVIVILSLTMVLSENARRRRRTINSGGAFWGGLGGWWLGGGGWGGGSGWGGGGGWSGGGGGSSGGGGASGNW